MDSFYHFYRRLIDHGPRSSREKLFFLALEVMSKIFGHLVAMRLKAYSSGFLKSYRASVPVISVGNLTVGGTGKTPVVDDLVKRAIQYGRRVAVVSRGYGGKRTLDPALLSDGVGFLHDDASLYGDEPVLIARRNPQAMVVVARKRTEGVQLVEKQGAEVIILDDAFQHLKLKRDMDILLVDSRHQFGNGRLLPAGPLREPVSNLMRADLIVLTHSNGQCPAGLDIVKPLLFSQSRFSGQLMTLHGERRSWEEALPLRCVAFAGIARPEGFFAGLREKGVNLVAEIPLHDHQVYTGAVLKDVIKACQRADLCLTTEKDAVKLASIDFPVPCWQVPLNIEITPQQILNEQLETFLQGSGKMKISSELLDILACPQCKRAVQADAENNRLICEHCQLAYPVRDDIPVMLIDEAESLSDNPQK